MNRIIGICFVVLVAAATLLLNAGNPKAQADCKLYTVNAPVLQVRKDSDTPGVYVTALIQGDTVCVSDAPEVGPQRLGYVVHKAVDGGTPVAVGGWASLIFMTPQDNANIAQSGSNADGSASQTTEPVAPAAQAPAPSQPATDAIAVLEGILKFTEPVPYGAHQVRGKSLKELVEGEPLFPPIEGLPESLWKKQCSSCHKWTAKLLCEQGQSYIPRAAEIFRHQHPYGGAYKLSLMRWSKTGCN